MHLLPKHLDSRLDRRPGRSSNQGRIHNQTAKLSGETQPRDNIYFNVVHSVDGAWNLDGGAMTNDEIIQAISNG